MSYLQSLMWDCLEKSDFIVQWAERYVDYYLLKLIEDVHIHAHSVIHLVRTDFMVMVIF